MKIKQYGCFHQLYMWRNKASPFMMKRYMEQRTAQQRTLRSSHGPVLQIIRAVASAAFSDLNGDGHLDLYVVNYLDESAESPYQRRRYNLERSL